MLLRYWLRVWAEFDASAVLPLPHRGQVNRESEKMEEGPMTN